MSELFFDLNAYYGDNVGDFNENLYKVNYKDLNCIDIEGQRTYILDIDIWSKDTILKETVSEDIEKMLNYLSYKCDEKWATFIFQTRYNADDKEIYRTTLNYEVRTY